MIEQRAAAQHGVFTRRDAHAAGFSDRRIRRRVDRGDWVELRQGVFRIAGAPSTWRADLVGAVLAGGPHAVASHRAAARLWRLSGGEEIVELTVPPGRGRRLRGVVVHECKALRRVDRHVVDGIPVAGPELTLLHLGAVLPPWRVDGLVDEALRAGLTDLPRLRGRLAALRRSGRNGSGVLRDLLERRAGPAEQAQSRLERSFLDLLPEGFPAPVLQHEVAGRFVDVAWPEMGVFVELDGATWHNTTARWEADLVRQNELGRHCRRLLRFTWRDVHERPGLVLRLLRDALVDDAA